MIKPGLKMQMLKLADKKAAPLELIRTKVLELIKGKKVVGYHLPQKMTELDMLGIPRDENRIQGAAELAMSQVCSEAYDIAKIFNATTAA